MESYLFLFVLLPILGYLINIFIPRKNEKVISLIAITTVGINLLSILFFTAYWQLNNHPTLDKYQLLLFETDLIKIFIDFYFDKTTAVFAIVGSLITFPVIIFSKSYLHRESEYKFFFNSVLLFYIAYNIIIFSGNFETFFIGWEFLGACSFLLISFYKDRYLPVKNSLKVISIYRLGDVCLILAMWMSHHLWHENITFEKLNDLKLVEEHLIEHNWYGVFISIMILIAAAAKSAQLPFSTWLPRAMEGPTTSSAVFYGSLSVNIGVFLLIRTYPYWESLLFMKSAVIITGGLTVFIATKIANVQSTVKTQIAYSSIAQIGLMFIEVALGYHNLALLHFTGNAFLRTYQMLVSPSVLSYRIHNMLFNFIPKKQNIKSNFSMKLKNSMYLLSVKEWNLDTLLKRILWDSLKWPGKRLTFLSHKYSVATLIVIFLSGLYCYYFQENIPVDVYDFLPHVFSFIGLLLFLKSFAFRRSAITAWLFVVGGQIYFSLSIALLNENLSHSHIALFLSGSVVAALIGYLSLKKIHIIDNDIDLNKFHGYSFERPRVAWVFLISCLAVIGLPFTPTFIGIDILFSHIHKHEELLILFTAISFALIELSVLRIYARVFLGQHKKAYHPIAYKSS